MKTHPCAIASSARASSRGNPRPINDLKRLYLDNAAELLRCYHDERENRLKKQVTKVYLSRKFVFSCISNKAAYGFWFKRCFR